MAGFNLIEMMIVVAVAGILLAVGAPTMLSNINTARIRGVAESIHTGISLARSEAIRRNAPMRFQLVSTLDNTCAYSGASGSAIAATGANSIPGLWAVSQYVWANSRGQVGLACDATLLTPADQEEPCPAAGYVYPGSKTCATDPWIAYKSSSDKVPGVDVVGAPTVASTPAGFIVTFGPVGQILDNFEGLRSAAVPVAYQVDVTPASGNSGTPYRVEVAANGAVRICVPGFVTSMVCAAP
jgi:prepilin-type N-terminal cleavage/methylation domain-containing protein